MKKIMLLFVACMVMAVPMKAQDTTPPVVSYATTFGAASTVVVQFSEKVDAVTASTKTNYTINNGVTVLERHSFDHKHE